MSYVYIESRSEELWTVGFYGPDGWIPESDHDKQEDAAARVHYLNGGVNVEPIVEQDEKFMREQIQRILNGEDVAVERADLKVMDERMTTLLDQAARLDALVREKIGGMASDIVKLGARVDSVQNAMQMQVDNVTRALLAKTDELRVIAGNLSERIDELERLDRITRQQISILTSMARDAGERLDKIVE